MLGENKYEGERLSWRKRECDLTRERERMRDGARAEERNRLRERDQS